MYVWKLIYWYGSGIVFKCIHIQRVPRFVKLRLKGLWPGNSTPSSGHSKWYWTKNYIQSLLLQRFNKMFTTISIKQWRCIMSPFHLHHLSYFFLSFFIIILIAWSWGSCKLVFIFCFLFLTHLGWISLSGLETSIIKSTKQIISVHAGLSCMNCLVKRWIFICSKIWVNSMWHQYLYSDSYYESSCNLQPFSSSSHKWLLYTGLTLFATFVNESIWAKHVENVFYSIIP